MTTEISGSKYQNSPFEDVFGRFKVKNGRIDLSEEAKLERAKIAREAGFLVDPVSGQGFWPTPVAVVVDPTKKSGGFKN